MRGSFLCICCSKHLLRKRSSPFEICKTSYDLIDYIVDDFRMKNPLYMCVYVCACMCVCMCVYVHVHMCICVYVHVCVCMCEYVHVCVPYCMCGCQRIAAGVSSFYHLESMDQAQAVRVPHKHSSSLSHLAYQPHL